MFKDALGSRRETGRIVDASGRMLFSSAIRPVGYFARLRGLIGRPPLSEGEAWWFSHCSAVHTIGMSHAIDVLHLSNDGHVLHICADLLPYRITLHRHSTHVMEMMAGSARHLKLSIGQQLRFVP